MSHTMNRYIQFELVFSFFNHFSSQVKGGCKVDVADKEGITPLIAGCLNAERELVEVMNGKVIKSGSEN